MAAEEQVLTVEQCKELVALGIDMSKASMCWYGKIHFDADGGVKYIPKYSLGTNEFYSALYAEHPDPDDAVEEKEICVPTFTLQDILDILPEDIIEHDGPQKIMMNLIMNKGNWKNNYQIVYAPGMDDWDGDESGMYYHSEVSESMLLCAFNTLRWLKTNKYI